MYTYFIYRTRAIITRSWLLTALNYKPRILGQEIDGFSFLAQKLAVQLNEYQTDPYFIQFSQKMTTDCLLI